MAATPSLTLAEIADRFGGEVAGDGETPIHGVSSLHRAGPGEISFFSDPRRRAELATTRASAVILPPEAKDATTLPRLVTANPYASYARVSQFFHAGPRPVPGIHPSAVVHPGARIAPTASVGALAHIGDGTQIGADTIVGTASVVGNRCVVGNGCLLHPRVTLYDDCIVGDRAIIHAGAVIGADGFGFANDGGRWIKIPQVGRVIIGDDVEIGANTTIDRGALDDTVIGNGVKLDNQIQIAHNVWIGDDTAIAACAGIAGSARIGRRCTIAGSAGINGHIEIPDDTHIQAMTMVSRTLTEKGVYSAAIPCSPSREWMKVVAHLKRLPELAARLRLLEGRTPPIDKD